MKKVLIVLSGEKNPPDFVRKLSEKADFVIGVDGGAEFLFINEIPFNVAIGDFDSVLNKKIPDIFQRNGIDVLKFPREKDFSDTELAVRFAIKKGYSDFVFTNALGKRTDHLLFNISVMLFLSKRKKRCTILEQNEEIYITNDKIKIETETGNTVSIYPLTQLVKIENSEGLKYPLKNKLVKRYSTLTLSNIATQKTVRLNVSSGTVLVLVEKKV